MAIKVNIPSGQNTATVSGLYQWDYGQVLEIESTDLSNMIGEVHFACSSMSEAIVVSCNFTEGLGSVTIPDECLEQSSNITAWIYEISGTQGRTRKVITIYVTARTRPSVAQDIPTEISNRYTELITEVNEAVDKLENGDVVVKKAKEATTATTATSAGNASTANHALSANLATMATKDALGYSLTNLLRCEESRFTKYIDGAEMDGGIIAFRIISSGQDARIITEVGGRRADCYSPIFSWEAKESNFFARLKFTYVGQGGGYTVTAELYNGVWEKFSPTIYYQHLSHTYATG